MKRSYHRTRCAGPSDRPGDIVETRALFFSTVLLFSILFGACQRKAPVQVIVEPQPPTPEVVARSEKILRSLFQSFWTPPSSDKGDIMVGLVSSAEKITFQSKEAMKIRVYTGEDYADITSPPNVLWSATATEVLREAVIHYLPVVEVRVFPKSKRIVSSSQQTWKEHGFPDATWIGPKLGNDTAAKDNQMERWVLSLLPAAEKKDADTACARARKLKGFCKVIARTEVAPRLKGTLSTEDRSFAMPFDGFVEILSNTPVSVFDFLAEHRFGKKSTETYLAPLYIVPLADKNLSLVQHVSLGNYLNTVVPSEIFPNAALEAVKAQAVVARTYFLRHLSEDASAHPYSICASTLCQVYRGIGKTNANSTRAVEETDSTLLWGDEGQPAETFYHSMCGGLTDEKSAIWGPPSQSYLQGISDAKQAPATDLSAEKGVQDYFMKNQNEAYFCGSSSYTNPERWRWTKTFDETFIQRLLAKHQLKGPLTNIRPLKRGRSGRILSLELVTPAKAKIVNGELVIRTQFDGLLSSLATFQFSKKGSTITSITVSGAGSGHGVGMCQVGAIGRAEHGQSYKEILQAYYPGSFLGPMVVQ